MTLTGILFLVALVGVFACFMGVLSYGLVVAGEAEQAAAPAGAAAEAGITGNAEQAAAADRPERKGRRAPALDEAA